MAHTYLTRLAASPRLLLGGLLLAAAPAVHAQQLLYTAGGAANGLGTYTDLGTTGTVISTNNNYDDANSAAQPIGFTFSFNGTAFTQFVLNTNGLLRLGANAPSAARAASAYAQAPELGPLDSTDPADVNLLLPFNHDLTAGTAGAEYRVFTSGSAPNRVCTIQWKNVADKSLPASATSSAAIAGQLNNFSFQVKLHETSNQIDFVYGAATAAGATALKYAQVGIKGSSATIGNTVLSSKASVDTWDLAYFLTGRQYTPSQSSLSLFNAFNFRSTFLPEPGQTLTFTACTPGVITTFPYSETFDSLQEEDFPCAATGEDTNLDTYTWYTADVSGAGDIGLVYALNEDAPVGGNDWFYTPGLTLRAGYTYRLKFDYAVFDGSKPEALEVKWGNATTPTAQANLLFSNTNLTNEAFATTTNAQVATITPATTGVYYIGFHEISASGKAALFVDNLVVTEAQSLPVRNAANAVFTAEAAPVPFGDHLSLHLNTLKAGPVALTLRDVMGRAVRQHRATAPLGSSTVALPEVASLPAGVYLLTVEQGGQSQVLRVTHQ